MEGRGSAVDTAPDVVVVGAGLSGLVAARELKKSGLDVLVLEARDRPGGRTQVAEMEGVAVDLGGEWVDAAHAEMRGLVLDLGLELVPTEGGKGDARWYVGGESHDEMPLSEGDAAVYGSMNERLSEIADRVDLDLPWTSPPAVPGKGPVPGEDVSVEEWLQGEGISGRCLHVASTLLSGCGSTVPLGRMSFYSYAVKAATRGGPGRGNEFRVAGGAGRVAEALAAGLEGTVRYSSPVTEVRQDGEGVEVLWRGAEGRGAARARRALLAVPFTCLRDVRFEPGLPGPVRRLVSEAVYGAARKTFLLFDEPVDPSAFTVTDTALGYLSAAQAPSGEEPRAIVSFCGGDQLLPELGLPVEVRRRRAAEVLRSVYEVPEPVRVVEKAWTEEHYTRGSYQILAPGDMDLFGEAMGGSFGSVHLAGSEGHAAAPSFMNSAVRSGLRAANEVAEALGPGAARRG